MENCKNILLNVSCLEAASFLQTSTTLAQHLFTCFLQDYPLPYKYIVITWEWQQWSIGVMLTKQISITKLNPFSHTPPHPHPPKIPHNM